mgnify:FL=1
MENKMFVGAEEMAEDLGVSRSKAYVIIKKLNAELENKGYMTLSGRVSRKYYIERLYGYDEYLGK